jgi:hypothetical protein
MTRTSNGDSFPAQARIDFENDMSPSVNGASLTAHASQQQIENGDMLVACESQLKSNCEWMPPSQQAFDEEARETFNLPDDDDDAILDRLRRQGPPGPASSVITLHGCAAAGPKLRHSSDFFHFADKSTASCSISSTALAENPAWLRAIRGAGLPFNAFHLGLGGSGGDSPMAKSNLSTVDQHIYSFLRWCLIVVVQRVEMIAGELSLIISDPTGHAHATVDRNVSKKWPHVASEGSALILVNAVAVPPVAAASKRLSRVADVSLSRPQVLITGRCLTNCVAASDVPQDEAVRLVAEAKSCLKHS